MEREDIIGKQTEPTYVKEKEIGIDTNNEFITDVIDSAEEDNLNLNALESFSNIAQTREEVYTLIDTMSQDDTISSVLETYTEDVVEKGDNGRIVWVESDDEKISKYLTYLIDSLNIDKQIYSWAFNLIKYGDVYIRLYRESDYNKDILFGDKEGRSTLNEDVKLNLTKGIDHYAHYVEMVSNPGEMFELTRFGKSMGYIQAPVRVQTNFNKDSVLNSYLTYKMKKSDVNVFSATDFAHACLQDNISRTPEEVDIYMNEDDYNNDTSSSSYKVKRGQSILYNSFKIWRELTLLENSMLLNRLTRSSIIRVLNIDIGDMPKEQVEDFMSRLKDKVEQKSALKVGKQLLEYTNPGPIENIIYVPTHGTQGTIQTQTIGGDSNQDIKSIADIDYFQDKLYGSLRIPKQFLNITDDSTGFNGGSSLTIISSRYGKQIKRIQNELVQLVTDIINLFLYDKQLTSYINKFKIRMQPPTTQEELNKRQNMRDRIGVINDIMTQVSSVVEDDIIKEKIVKVLLSETSTSPEVISLMQEDIENKEGDKEKVEEQPQEEEVKEGIEVEEERTLPTPSSIGDYSSEPVEEPSIENEAPTSEEPIESENEEETFLPSPSDLDLDLTSGF